MICPTDTSDSKLWGFLNLMVCRVPFFSLKGWLREKVREGLSNLLHRCNYLLDQVIEWDGEDGFGFFVFYAFVFSTGCIENGNFC